MSPRKRIAIVGGGPGGLCAAMLLQARGFEVTVLERFSPGSSAGLEAYFAARFASAVENVELLAPDVRAVGVGAAPETIDARRSRK